MRGAHSQSSWHKKKPLHSACAAAFCLWSLIAGMAGAAAVRYCLRLCEKNYSSSLPENLLMT